MKPKINNFGPNGAENDMWAFHCPGCRRDHLIYVPKWTWNNSTESPTFTPNLLIHNEATKTNVCHLIITDGVIQFLNDTTHDLSGQTVILPDW